MYSHLDSPDKQNAVYEQRSRELVAWYDRHARSMPWRVGPKARKHGLLPDPYHVWLSEVMLQQTQVATVRDYFLKFIDKWPSIDDLAHAETEDVMRAWAGLGYYSRARNLKNCAETIARDHAGSFPRRAVELKQLPGIGDYTASAIAAIAFDEPVAVVDGNVERVVTRLHAIDIPLPLAKPAIKSLTEAMLATDRPGDFAQAMMDLGATICSPRRPACSLCPISAGCIARAAGNQERFPVKAVKAEKPIRRGAAYVAIRADGAVLLRKRADRGLLAGMSEVPTTGWSARADGTRGVNDAPFGADWRLAGTVRHTFTHFHLELEVWKAICRADDESGIGWWSPAATIAGEALPTVMKKVIATAIPTLFRVG